MHSGADCRKLASEFIFYIRDNKTGCEIPALIRNLTSCFYKIQIRLLKRSLKSLINWSGSMFVKYGYG